MPITYINPDTHEGTPKPTYEGCVISTRVERDRRIMSDVWADCFYATVWTGTEVTEIGLGANHVSNGVDDAVVDATDEVKATVAVWRAVKAEVAEKAWEAKAPEREAAYIKAKAAKKAEAECVAKAYLNSPTKGDRVVVARRRGKSAPPKGTEGIVFWTGTSGFGTSRVGFKTDLGETHWTTAANCDVVLPGLAASETPAEGWVAYADRLRGERREAADKRVIDRKAKAEADLAALPAMGTWVRGKDDPTSFGKVFWRGITKNGEGQARIGFKIRKKDRDASWAGIGEFDVLTGDPRKRGVVLDAVAEIIEKDPLGLLNTSDEPEIVEAPVVRVLPVFEVGAPLPLAHLPAPFNKIVGVDSKGIAYDEKGKTLVTLAPTEAETVRGLLAGVGGAA